MLAKRQADAATDSIPYSPLPMLGAGTLSESNLKYSIIFGDCSIATGADSKIARQEQGESTWDPLNASELAPNSANGLIPSLIAWAKSQPPGNVAIVSRNWRMCSRPTA